MTLAASGYPFLDLMWTLLVFFGWVIWFWLLIIIFGDLLGRHDVAGWRKAGWTVLLIALPFVGVLVYLVVEGHDMAERRRAKQEATRAEFDDYVRSASVSARPSCAAGRRLRGGLAERSVPVPSVLTGLPP